MIRAARSCSVRVVRPPLRLNAHLSHSVLQDYVHAAPPYKDYTRMVCSVFDSCCVLLVLLGGGFLVR